MSREGWAAMSVPVLGRDRGLGPLFAAKSTPYAPESPEIFDLRHLPMNVGQGLSAVVALGGRFKEQQTGRVGDREPMARLRLLPASFDPKGVSS